ncbi:MAG: antitoxin [Thermodesulfobacteriota bacterium]|nr:antitoxin [Thermodesulfobacteriota bacterium]
MDELNNYEKEILDSYENDEWESIKNLEQKKKEYAQIAKNTFLKNKRINIRISEKDFIDIKTKSLEEGVPYQTLISSIIHKYVSGKLIEPIQ